jgi:hypothetical protein
VVLIVGLTGVRSSARPRFAPTFTFCNIGLTGALIYIKPRRFYFFFSFPARLPLCAASQPRRAAASAASSSAAAPSRVTVARPAPPPRLPAPPPPPRPQCAAHRPSPPPHLLAVAPGHTTTTALLCSCHRCTSADQPPCSPSAVQSPPPRAISASPSHPLSYVTVPSRAAVAASSN